MTSCTHPPAHTPDKLWWRVVLFSVFLCISPLILRAEGSVDFINYPGYRLFMDTRDSQQVKVFARLGEFLNVGASHVGIKGGYIKVYRPDGTLVATFDNTGTSTGLAIINNNIEELNGPTGGGTTNGPGYVPGVVQVDQEGVWTIRFDYPGEVELEPFPNILNGAPWNRVLNQPFTRRVILAWDVTVSSGAPGNEGGTLLSGRVYSNEYISLLYENGVTTSPTFWVLTRAGYLYRVNFVDTDPYRFPISSNSVGVVEGGTLKPTYSSHAEADFIRSPQPDTWLPGMLYLYEPQARDYGDQIVNNKIFFNPPDPGMPATALVTDIYRNDTHTTWLFNQPVVPEVTDFRFEGIDTIYLACGDNTMIMGQGGFFAFTSNVQAQAFLHLDLNNDGDFDDAVDRTIQDFVKMGSDSIYWDGLDGLGDSIPVNPAFSFNARLDLRVGEVHISVTDIENNYGGIYIILEDGDPSPEDSLFYYDHSPVGGPVSGGGTPGNPLPTNVPYTYSNGVGNNQFHDQWTFQDFEGQMQPLVIRVVDQCIVCNAVNTPDVQTDTVVTFCESDSIVLQVQNANPGAAGPIVWLLQDSAGTVYDSVSSADPLMPVPLRTGQAGFDAAGTYLVVAISGESCADTVAVQVQVHPLPVMQPLAMAEEACEGETAILSAINATPGIDSLFYTWHGPADTIMGAVGGSDTVRLVLPDAQHTHAGLWMLTAVSEIGCAADTLQGQLLIHPIPIISDITSDTTACTGEPIALSAANAAPDTGLVTYTWTGPDGSVHTAAAPASGPFDLMLDSVGPQQAGPWVLRLSSAAGCLSAPDTMVLSVAPRPRITGVTGGGTYCMLDTLVLSGSNSTPGLDMVVFAWIGPDGFVLPGIGDGTGPYEVSIPLDSVAQSGAYSLVLSAPGGCVSDTVTVPVTVLPTPVATDITGGGVYCLGTPGMLSATNAVPGLTSVTYTWTGPNGFFVQATTGPAGPFTADLGTTDGNDVGIYTLTLEGDNGCSSGPYVVAVDTISNLVITNMMGGGHYCAGEDVVLSANTLNTGGIDIIAYTWTGPNGLVVTDTVGPDDSFELVIANAQPDDSGTYCLTLTADNGCTTPAPACVEVSITNVPAVDIVTVDTVTCADSVLLEALLSGLDSSDQWTATWRGPNDYQQQMQGSGNGTLTHWIASPPAGPGSGAYALQVVTADTCASSVDTVFIEWSPTVMLTDLQADSDSYCAGDTIRLSANGMVTQQLSTTDKFTLEIGTAWALPGEQVCLDVKAYNFTDMLGMQWSIEWDSSQLQFEGVDNINLPFLGPASFSFFADRLGMVWYDLNVQGLSVPDGTSLFRMCFTVTGSSAVDFAEVPTVLELVDLNGIITDYALIGGYVFEGPAPAATCVWIAPDGTVYTAPCPIDGPFTFEVPATLDASGTWCFTMEGNSLCGPVDTVCVDVTVNPVPEIVLIDSVIITCADTLLLTATSENIPPGEIVSYTWTGPGGFSYSGTAPAPGPYEATVTGQPQVPPGLYCLELETAQGCQSEARCIFVQACQPPIVTPQTDTTIVACEGEDVLFCARLEGPGLDSLTYQWVDAAGNVLQSGTGMPGDVVCLQLAAVTLAQAGTLTLEVTGWPGGGTTSQQFHLVVHPVPEPVGLTANEPVCEGDTLWLSASNGAPGSGLVDYVWTGPNGFVFTGTADWAGPFTAWLPAASLNDVGEYCVQLFSQAGCVSDTACIPVEVLVRPEVGILSGSQTGCPGDSVTLGVAVDLMGQSGTYQWISPGGEVFSGAVSGQDTLFWIVGPLGPADVGTWTFELSTQAGCPSLPVVFDISLFATDSIGLSANLTEICPGESLLLTADGPMGGSAWYWYRIDENGERQLLGATTEPMYTLDPGMPGTYVVQAVDANGCLTAESEGLLVYVFDAPVAEDDFAEGPLNMPLVIDVLANDVAPDGWILSIASPPQNGSARFDDNGMLVYEPNTNFFGTDELIYQLCSEACPELCAQARVIIAITTDECEVPNVLTPNGDGANDKLIIPCLDNPCCNTDNTLRIFNRWGDEIYSASPYRNDWEGTYGDKPLPAGTYFYLLQLDAEGRRVLQGFITIVR